MSELSELHRWVVVRRAESDIKKTHVAVCGFRSSTGLLVDSKLRPRSPPFELDHRVVSVHGSAARRKPHSRHPEPLELAGKRRCVTFCGRGVGPFVVDPYRRQFLLGTLERPSSRPRGGLPLHRALGRLRALGRAEILIGGGAPQGSGHALLQKRRRQERGLGWPPARAAGRGHGGARPR